MAHIPPEAQWYVAELVVEITVEDDPRNVVHKNLVLIRADSPEEAYEKALSLGREAETFYENPAGKQVRFKFRGLSELNVIQDELDHGAELLYEQKVGVASEEIEKWVLPKKLLTAFRSTEPGDWPDYSSKEIMDDVSRLMGHST
jgi:uncharacterized protein DUF4288